MNLLADGHAVADIAAQLQVTAKTVRNNLTKIFAKMGVHRQQDAILVWLGYNCQASPER